MFIIRRWPVPLSVNIRSSSRYFNTADIINLLSINIIVDEEKRKKLMLCSSAITARYSLPQRTKQWTCKRQAQGSILN